MAPQMRLDGAQSSVPSVIPRVTWSAFERCDRVPGFAPRVSSFDCAWPLSEAFFHLWVSGSRWHLECAESHVRSCGAWRQLVFMASTAVGCEDRSSYDSLRRFFAVGHREWHVFLDKPVRIEGASAPLLGYRGEEQQPTSDESYASKVPVSRPTRAVLVPYIVRDCPRPLERRFRNL